MAVRPLTSCIGTCSRIYRSTRETTLRINNITAEDIIEGLHKVYFVEL